MIASGHPAATLTPHQGPIDALVTFPAVPLLPVHTLPTDATVPGLIAILPAVADAKGEEDPSVRIIIIIITTITITITIIISGGVGSGKRHADQFLLQPQLGATTSAVHTIDGPAFPLPPLPAGPRHEEPVPPRPPAAVGLGLPVAEPGLDAGGPGGDEVEEVGGGDAVRPGGGPAADPGDEARVQGRRGGAEDGLGVEVVEGVATGGAGMAAA